MNFEHLLVAWAQIILCSLSTPLGRISPIEDFMAFRNNLGIVWMIGMDVRDQRVSSYIYSI